MRERKAAKAVTIDGAYPAGVNAGPGAQPKDHALSGVVGQTIMTTLLGLAIWTV